MLPLKRIYCKHHRAATSIMQFSDRQLQRKGSWLIISLSLVPERGKLKKFLRFMCSTLNFQHSCSNTGCVQCIPTDLWYVAFADYTLQAMVLKHSAVMPHQKHQQHLLYSHNLTSFIASRVHSGGSCLCLPIKRSIVHQNGTR